MYNNDTKKEIIT